MPNTRTRFSPACSRRIDVKSAMTSGVMYECGSPISYTSCSRDRRHGDAPAGVRMLGDDEGAVGRRLRRSDSRCSPDRGSICQSYETVAARALRAALDDVAGDDARGELVPVVVAPAELEAKRRHGERRVGRAAGDDDVRALGRAPRRSAPSRCRRWRRARDRERWTAARRSPCWRAHGRCAISSSSRGSRSSPVTTPMRTASETPCFLATCAHGRGARRRIHAARVGDDANAARRRSPGSTLSIAPMKSRA